MGKYGSRSVQIDTKILRGTKIKLKGRDMNKVRKFAAAVAVAAGVTAVLAASAVRADDDGPWEVRLRAVYLDPANKSEAIPALLVPEDAIHINSKVLPDLDFEYYFVPNWSTELLLTYPQTQ